MRKRNRTGFAWFAATMVVAWSVLMAMAITSAGAIEKVCAGTKVDFGSLPATINGVTITVVDSNTVHFDIPGGSTVTVCVKAGSANQGLGPEVTTLTADANLDHSSGKDISHVSVISVTTPTTPPPTTPPPTTPPPTTPPPTTAKITICHRTNSATNPYVEITVARQAADGIAGNSGNEADHYGEHQGPLASSEAVAQALKNAKIEWGDIIPNVDDDGNPMPHNGWNWTAAGQAMWANDCAFVAPPTTPPPTTPPPTTPPPTTPPPTTPPPTTPPPTTPPPTTPPPTTPPPTTPPPAVSVLIEKTNDANEDGIYSNNEQSKNDGSDVDFKLVITNTSDFEVEITDLTDSFDQTTIDLLDDECSSLAGMVLDPGESVTCTFSLNNYSPAQGTAIVNVAEVCVELVGGTATDCDTNPSRVHTATVLGQTVTPTNTPPPTRTPPGGIAFTGPESTVPLTALAFALLTLGMGFLWAGNRKRQGDER